MATPQKKFKPSSKTGFLQNVSPVKTSKANKKYFNATIQTETAYEEIVSFKPEHHKTFVDMSSARTPVCLQNVDSIPSMNHAGKFDIKYAAYSRIQEPQETLSFSYIENESSITTGTIQKIKETAAKYDKVTVSCKVQQVSTPEKVESSKDLTKMSIAAADETATITITVWNEQIKEIQKNCSYKFENLSVRMFNDEMSLTTNIASKITRIPDMEEVKTIDEPMEAVHEIEAVSIQRTENCVFCNTALTINHQVPTTKCHSCSKKMLTKCIKTKLNTVITVGGKDHTISEEMMASACENHHTMSTDELEDFVLLSLKAKMCANSVVGFDIKT